MINSSHTSSEHSSAPAPAEAGPAARALLSLIGLYQRLHAGRVSPCRFYPSCSAYAREAVDVHGAARGTGLALRRLLKCRPLGPHGIDLVPEPRPARSAR